MYTNPPNSKYFNVLYNGDDAQDKNWGWAWSQPLYVSLYRDTSFLSYPAQSPPLFSISFILFFVWKNRISPRRQSESISLLKTKENQTKYEMRWEFVGRTHCPQRIRGISLIIHRWKSSLQVYIKCMLYR